MQQPPMRLRWLPLIRFWLGLNLLIFLLYLVVPMFSESRGPGLTPLGMLQSFFLTGLGLALGITYARYWPLPQRPGFGNVIRILLLTIPAVGFSLALGLLMRPQVSAMFLALAAYLGAQLRRPRLEPDPRGDGPAGRKAPRPRR